MIRIIAIFITLVLSFKTSHSQNFQWSMLPNSPVPDSASQRFEDISMVDANTGWIAMYSGKLYKTTDGGNSWTLNLTGSNFPYSNFRSLGFFDSQFGLLGTLNSFGPMQRTTNGGDTWSVVNNIPAPLPYGICGISIVDSTNAYAVGRYAAPANVIKTTDKGATWTSIVLNPNLVKSLVDCYFWSPDSGIIVGGYNTSGYNSGNAVILKTTNGGTTWQRVYISSRSGEWCWKISFVSKTTGYVSIERHSGLAYILKTTNAGQSWSESPFQNYDVQGIGFIDEYTGWTGGWTGPTFETTNGGQSWTQSEWGYFVNRFRFLNDTLAFAVGDRVYKYLRGNGITPVVRFAAVGDYGSSGPNESAVSNLIKSWDPEFVITLGDNNYESGEQSTIDVNIGQYYNQFISPYTGNYGTGDSVNRFFPSLGDHDWITAGATPYLDYFTLPGNERYYDFVKGNIHFFCIDSDVNEPDGNDSNSVQAQWLKNKLSESSETFNIVYFHHSPYNSGTLYGSNAIMRWPFKSWGASAVLSGHEHFYERLTVNNMTYFVNGLGGKSIHSFSQSPISGSQKRYNSNYGAMLIESFEDNIVFKFRNITANQIDVYKIFKTPKTLELTAFVEGFYNPAPGGSATDVVSVYIRNSNSPYLIVDSLKGNLSPSGIMNLSFPSVKNGTDYYIQISHRNSIDTWSALFQRFAAGKLKYDFSTSADKAYGNNLVLKGTKYCIYSGDVNKDGIIDGSDLSEVENSVTENLFGYINTDLNGDYTVDAADLSIVENNSSFSVMIQAP